jgi:U3 small nucleolar RNA-associated protein 18
MVSFTPMQPRKRRKRTEDSKEIRPLGLRSLEGDDSKDDEEKRLESILFGTKFTPRKKELIELSDEDGNVQLGEGGQEMNILMDSDVSCPQATLRTV